MYDILSVFSVLYPHLSQGHLVLENMCEKF